MLAELYQYALSHELIGRPGFKLKSPKAYLHISAAGQFLELELRDRNAAAVMAPDVGSAANGSRFCNPLIEKAKIPLCIVEKEDRDKNIPVKHEFFLKFLEEGQKAEPLFGIAAQALRTPETRKQMQEALQSKNLKPDASVGLTVDGTYLEQSTLYADWWDNFRKCTQPVSKDSAVRCLITGNLSQPMATVPKVSGLSQVGGRASGDAFLCFDKDAFQSYGLKQSANAAVSEEAMTAVNAALGKLIQKAKILGGTKMVHWYSDRIEPEEDLFDLSLGESLRIEPNSPDPDEEQTDPKEKERTALQTAQNLVQSLEKGYVPTRPDLRYYIMPLSGAGGRIMVRGWYEGSYASLYEHIRLWFEDLRLILPYGGGTTRPPRLEELCCRMLKPGGGSRSARDRLDSELGNLTQRVVYAVVQGEPLPDEAAYRALQWLRSDVLTNPRIEKKHRETLAYQLLKAWLRRKQRREGEPNLMTEELNKQNRSAAYLCGRLMAVYSAIQERAMPENNVGVAERYFSAAMTSPGLVIGKLAQLSQHHLAKLETGARIYYEKILTETYSLIGNPQNIPTALTVLQQTEFALGYYQQRAEIFSGKKQEARDE